MKRLLLLPVLLGAAVLIAGVYGVLHNQVSYVVGPSYFHDFKFIQFDIASTFQNRIGAAWVGWQASWWMGVIIGGPILLLGARMKDARAFVIAYTQAAAIVLLTALVFGSGALIYAIGSVTETSLPPWMSDLVVNDPVGYGRAGWLHLGTYFGGFIGLLIGMAYMQVRAYWHAKKVLA